MTLGKSRSVAPSFSLPDFTLLFFHPAKVILITHSSPHQLFPTPFLNQPSIMSTAEYVVKEKLVLKAPPPAFSDIAKSSNDVSLSPHLHVEIGAIANSESRSLSTRTSTTMPQVGSIN